MRLFSMDWKALMSGQPLRWVQPSVLKMNYELKSGDSVVGNVGNHLNRKGTTPAH